MINLCKIDVDSEEILKIKMCKKEKAF